MLPPVHLIQCLQLRLWVPEREALKSQSLHSRGR